MTPENVFKTTEDLDLSLTSLYGSLLGLQCNSNTTIVQVMGDDVTSTTGSNKAAYLASDAFMVPSDVKGSEDLWKNLYAIIKNCNYTIDCAKHIGVAETGLFLACIRLPHVGTHIRPRAGFSGECPLAQS